MARPPELPDHSLSAKWFSTEPRHSVPPPSLRPPPPPPIGHPGWSATLGAFAGALGGFVALLATQYVASLQHSRFDFVLAIGRMTGRLVLGHDFPGAAFVFPVLVGAWLGSLLGFLSRRLLRILPRLLFFCLFLPILLLFVQALVVQRFAPGVAGSLPLGPLVAGTIVYAVFVAVVSPVRLH